MKTKNTALLAVMLSLLALGVTSAFAQTEVPAFPIGINDTTLTIVVLGGIAGAAIANIEGYNKKAGPTESWNVQKFLPTLVFCLLVGVGTGVGLTSFLQVDVGDSIIKGFVLFALVTFVVRNIEQAREGIKKTPSVL